MQHNENEIIELTVELQRQGNQLNAKTLILEELKPLLTDEQRAHLEKIYAHTRRQHLTNFALEEDQSEAVEALFDELEFFLGK
ncbi:hypothetical protein [Aggregatibacter actinomycetemcomitans]|uniref:hypothetical protein n=1 Tax=Aggregatibacter actinomycetemcomitans TaxID=714 RepID=UPI00197C2A84|nr:hypothetical protein [Aggregatibacter actinomycetemcomitans]MBN6079915.1 hypothetical protein [Aggregatibacter actinomycetemcomitans]